MAEALDLVCLWLGRASLFCVVVLVGTAMVWSALNRVRPVRPTRPWLDERPPLRLVPDRQARRRQYHRPRGGGVA